MALGKAYSFPGPLADPEVYRAVVKMAVAASSRPRDLAIYTRSAGYNLLRSGNEADRLCRSPTEEPMIRAACHCGAVRIIMDPAPSWVLDCNCSICRRYGALWAYTRDRLAERDLSARLVQGSEAIEAYIWGDRDLATWRCKACGCVTHGTLVGTPSEIRSVNARMFAQFDPASVTIHRTDNGHTGWFWTRPDAPIWPASYPPSEPSEADDWR